MSEYLWQQRDSGRRVMNLTPMVDVIFQLIVFLIIGAQFTEIPIIDLKLPEAGTAEVTEKEIPVITVDREGRLYLRRDELKDIGELRARLKVYRDETGRHEIQVLADKGVEYGSVMAVVDLCRELELRELVLGMEAPK